MTATLMMTGQLFFKLRVNELSRTGRAVAEPSELCCGPKSIICVRSFCSFCLSFFSFLRLRLCLLRLLALCLVRLLFIRLSTCGRSLSTWPSSCCERDATTPTHTHTDANLHAKPLRFAQKTTTVG